MGVALHKLRKNIPGGGGEDTCCASNKSFQAPFTRPLVQDAPHRMSLLC